MSNPSKQKGTAFESAVVTYLREHDVTARRNALTGAQDSGDIRVGPWTLEAKNRRVYDFGTAVDEAKAEAAHAGTPRYAAVIKRNGKGDVARAFVVMELEQFTAVLIDAGMI